MDALRKQASKLREQVAKQQQFSISGYESSDVVVIDEVEMQRHQQLEKLHTATRAGKDFQKEIVKAAETFTAIGYKHIEAGIKLSEDCCRYGAENISDNILAKAASVYGDAHKHVEKEQEELNRLLSSQREEISRRQARIRESPTAEHVAKLHAAEAKMRELKANVAVLGKEAAAALAAVDAQQQRLTFQRLVAMVEGEKTFHLRVAAILGEIEAETISDRQKKEFATPVVISENGSEKTMYFLAETMHPFCAESEEELSFAKGQEKLWKRTMEQWT